MTADTEIAEGLRLGKLVALNIEPADRPMLEQRYGEVWNAVELSRDFQVLGFMAPFVVARRKSDGTTGSLEFQHHPRFYFNWREDR